MALEATMTNQPATISPGRIVLMLLIVVVVPFLPLLISGQWDWWEAWVYALVGVLGFVISRVLVARRHPDLIAERARYLQHADAKPWDRQLSLSLGVGGALIPLVAGLDARFDWSGSYSLAVILLSLLGIVAGYVLGSYALIENRFFSGMVRIQTDRGHQVVSSGPYRWVRHPGYAGALLTYLATPIFLESAWTFLPVLFTAIVLVVRTNLEDQTLHEELPGYREYAQRVRYRLLPGVW
jgi:protein-S-isoprenylcysteine O-methyltransferase Ste14